MYDKAIVIDIQQTSYKAYKRLGFAFRVGFIHQIPPVPIYPIISLISRCQNLHQLLLTVAQQSVRL